MNAPKSLPAAERDRLTDLYRDSGGTALAGALARLSDKGRDVSLFPFRLLDRMLWDTDLPLYDDLALSAQFLAPGRDRLFRAVLAHRTGDKAALTSLEADAHTAPDLRWEARAWRVALAHLTPNLPDTGPAIPRILQFWDKGNRPPEIDIAMEGWASLGTPHKAFTDRHAARFIARVAGAEAAATYDALWHPALKSDLFRLYALYDRGGLYADADSLPQEGIERFLAHGGGRVWASAVTDRANAATVNGFLAAPAGHPLIAAFIDQVLRDLRADTHRNIYWLAGPGALTNFLAQGEHDLSILPSGLLKSRLFQQIDAPYKDTPKNWRVYERKEGLSDAPVLAAHFQA